jgi:hypothetical protein
MRSDSLLATSAPVSVVPPSIRHALDLQIAPVPGWQGVVPTWYGIACTVGRATIWLPVEETPGLYRDFSLLVLLPKRDLPDAPPFIHLGMQFLVEYGGQVTVDGSGPGTGRLVLP